MLRGTFHVWHESGMLIADFPGTEPALSLKTPWRTYRLFPVKPCIGQQLSLSFGVSEPIDLLAEQLGGQFRRILNVLQVFKERQAELLYFCLAGGESALEIVEQCPALGFLCAGLCGQSCCPTTSLNIKSWVTCKRQELLALGGFPGEKWVVRLLQKILASECRHELFDLLRVLVASDNGKVKKKLQHLKSVNYLVVKLLSEPRFARLFCPAFLPLLSQFPSASRQYENFWQIHRIRETVLEGLDRGLKIPLIRSFEDLKLAHDTVVEWLQKEEFFRSRKLMNFSLPPIRELALSTESGEDYGIFPICDNYKLWEEGKRMHHCIAGYDHQIKRSAGKLYPYHVAIKGYPPATLLIELDYVSKEWDVQELRGPCNDEVSPEVKRIIKNWLLQHNRPELNIDVNTQR